MERREPRNLGYHALSAKRSDTGNDSDTPGRRISSRRDPSTESIKSPPRQPNGPQDSRVYRSLIGPRRLVLDLYLTVIQTIHDPLSDRRPRQNAVAGETPPMEHHESMAFYMTHQHRNSHGSTISARQTMVSRTEGRSIFRQNQEQRESPGTCQNHPEPTIDDLCKQYLCSITAGYSVKTP